MGAGNGRERDKSQVHHPINMPLEIKPRLAYLPKGLALFSRTLSVPSVWLYPPLTECINKRIYNVTDSVGE